MAINSDHRGNQAFAIYPFGYDELNFNFPTNTELYYPSCPLVFNNKLYAFGGSDHIRQISQVIGCGLERIGNLEFDFFAGACTVMGGKQIMLCFHGIPTAKQGRVCRVAQSPTGPYNTIQESNYHHYGTNIASSGGKFGLFITLD